MAEAPLNGLKRLYQGEDDDTVNKKSRSNNGSPAPPPGSKPDTSKLIADARARAAAVAERLKGSKAGRNGISAISQVSSPDPVPAATTRPLSKIEEMRARVAALTGRNNASPGPGATSMFPAPAYEDGISRSRGGLSAALHPSLLSDVSKEQAPKFPSAKQSGTKQDHKGGKKKKELDLTAPDAEAYRTSGFFDASLGAQTATLKTRKAKQLQFNAKGKYIQAAASARRLEALEAMRKRIAATSKKAGLDDDPSEKSFMIEAPPDIEWWDEGLVTNGKDYRGIESASGVNIDKEDSIVTRFVQNPIQIVKPGGVVAVKPMFLTPREQKKLRRQRRMQDLKDEQTKQRLGLLPAPEPKVKKGNLMRVLGEQAVKDPTAVEAMVNKQIADRAQKHEDMNEERKLTKEERHDKLAKKVAEDAAKGIHLVVFKIDSLANGRQRFKINKNAEQMSGTGLCIYHPRFNLVLFEGGTHSIKDYKKLMLNRIDWQENSPGYTREGNKEALNSWLQPEEADGTLKDLSLNKCTLVFEGEQKGRSWKRWQSKVCETDKEAMDLLERAKMGSMWTLAKSMQ